jgi:hypothetical protein
MNKKKLFLLIKKKKIRNQKIVWNKKVQDKNKSNLKKSIHRETEIGNQNLLSLT